MILIQISAAQGPEECCLAVAKVLDRMLDEAKQRDLSINVIESLAGERAHTFRSVVLGVDGDAALAWAKAWIGNVQWTCPSPYRPHHPRKNWFIGIRAFEENTVNLASEIRYEACRANGPGGQHVNKTDSAIRATHIATGISVKVQTERSQHANKKIAALLIAHKLSELTQQSKSLERYQRHQSHQTIERGDAHLIFRGERFVKV